MNQIALRTRPGNPNLEVMIDGRPLAEHFSDYDGHYPIEVFTLGWRSAPDWHNKQVLEQLAGRAEPELPSGRIPLLVCPECGDTACGALAARITHKGDIVTWEDWAYETGNKPAQDIDGPIHVNQFNFLAQDYEKFLAELKAANKSMLPTPYRGG